MRLEYLKLHLYILILCHKNQQIAPFGVLKKECKETQASSRKVACKELSKLLISQDINKAQESPCGAFDVEELISVFLKRQLQEWMSSDLLLDLNEIFLHANSHQLHRFVDKILKNPRELIHAEEPLPKFVKEAEERGLAKLICPMGTFGADIEETKIDLFPTFKMDEEDLKRTNNPFFAPAKLSSPKKKETPKSKIRKEDVHNPQSLRSQKFFDKYIRPSLSIQKPSRRSLALPRTKVVDNRKSSVQHDERTRKSRRSTSLTPQNSKLVKKPVRTSRPHDSSRAPFPGLINFETFRRSMLPSTLASPTKCVIKAQSLKRIKDKCGEGSSSKPASKETPCVEENSEFDLWMQGIVALGTPEHSRIIPLN